MRILSIIFVFCVSVFGAALFFVSSSNAVSAIAATDLVRYKLVPEKSQFVVHTSRSGLAWFKGHEHLVAVRDFSGEAALTLNVLNPASLKMTIDASSLEETHPKIPEAHKTIINRELDEIVLESEKYPEITFQSSEITGTLKNGTFEVKVAGDITLHGVTRRVVIPATVTLEGDTFRARGQFKLDRSDYKVKTPSAFHGFVKVGDTLKFDFDIVGQRL